MIRFANVTKTYTSGLTVLKEANLHIIEKEMVCIYGESGSGKSTIFNLIVGKELPTLGDIFFKQVKINTLPVDGLPYLRRTINIITQQNHFIQEQNVFYNLILPLLIQQEHSISNSKKEIEYVLKLVGLTDRQDFFPKELSMSEQKKLSVARAILNKPSVVMFDEPMANLDYKATKEITKLIQYLNKQGITVIITTNDMNFMMDQNIKHLVVKDQKIENVLL